MAKIGVISLGCAKNRVDTEQMICLMENAGHTITTKPEEADAIVVNTCGFIDSAKEESINAILEMAEYKKTGKCKALCVTGCLAQRYAQALKGDMPEIDALVGVERTGEIVKAIEDALKGDRSARVGRGGEMLECGRVLTTPHYSAYIRIAEGCDNRCAYCAIPLIRGPYRSRARKSIIGEMRHFAERGAIEQTLIAQDTSRYGVDTGDSLSSLIREGAGIEGIRWLRALYMYPDEVDERLLDEMEAHENVCKYLDLPLQHASPELLRKMNRRGDMEKTRRLLLSARARGFTLRTTFIVGFPGETEEDFERLYDFTKEIEFDRMGAFAYSREEDTPAYDFEGQIPEEVKHERLDRLMELQRGISRALNEKRIGKVYETLVTDARGRGRTRMEAPEADGEILFKPLKKHLHGDMIRVKITGAQDYDLKGEEVADESAQ